MQRLLLSIGVVLAVAGFTDRAAAQSSGAMPGTVVSSPSSSDHLRLIGREQPDVGKKVGNQINPSGAMMRPYNPANPYEQLQGTNLSPSSVVAPINGYPGAVQPGMFQQVMSTLESLVGLNTKPAITPIYTPGIYRRDRERVRERLWMRD